MMHRCTWKGCGIPATKKLHIRLKNPYYIQMHRDGTRTREKSEGQDLWRCDQHYEECLVSWENSDIFIVEP